MIDEVCLIAPSAMTHGNNFSQRRVKLDFEKVTFTVVVDDDTTYVDNLACTAPWEPEIAPPGDYMLFVVQAGVPSVAAWVRLQQPADYVVANGESVTWAGKVHLDRDFTVEYGGKLTVLGGTDVMAFAGRDSLGTGDFVGHSEVIVKGRLLAEGTPTSPITFSSHLGTGAAGEWGGLRFDLAGAASTTYGYIASLQEPSKLKSVAISNAKVGIQIEGLCAPGLEAVTFSNIDASGGFATHILLDQTDVALPYGWWNGSPINQANFRKDIVKWDLESPMNVVATNTIALGKDHPLTAGWSVGHQGKVDLFIDGWLVTHNTTGPVDYVRFRPETMNDDLGDGWGGIEIHSQASGTTFRYAEVSHAVDPLFFTYPTSCLVRNSKIHHYAHYGVWVIGSGTAGVIVRDTDILRGAMLDIDRGVWAVYADKVSAFRLRNCKIYDYDHSVGTTWQQSSQPGGGVRLIATSPFCQTQPSTADSVVIQGNTVVGFGESVVTTERSGLEADWACGSPNRKVAILGNAIAQWTFGTKLSEARDVQLSCNRITNNRTALEFQRVSTPTSDPEVRFKQNLADSSLFRTVRVTAGIEKAALGHPTSTSDRGLNKFVVDAGDLFYVTQDDGVYVDADSLWMCQNVWHDGSVEQIESDVINQCEPTTGDNRKHIKVAPLNTTNPYTIACLPPSASIVAPGGSQGRQLLQRGELASGGGAIDPDLAAKAIESPEKIARSELNRIHPNPFSGTVEIQFAVKAGDEAGVKVSLFDVGGRLVKRFVDGPTTEGMHRLTWNGENSSGDKLGSGIYFVRFEAGNVRETRRLVMLK